MWCDVIISKTTETNPIQTPVEREFRDVIILKETIARIGLVVSFHIISKVVHCFKITIKGVCFSFLIMNYRVDPCSFLPADVIGLLATEIV